MTATTLQETSTHPKGVGFLSFTQMWESFSFFGMRALLVLYLVSEAGYSYADAVILYTLYIALVKLFAAVGGYAVDRFLGYKRAVLIGGGLILVGHLLLTFSSYLYLSLGSIVCGSALFRVSLQALLGLLYAKEDPRREKGFTLLYIGMNVGGLLAAVLCGIVAEIYGWHAGFGLAAFGMSVGMAVFIYRIQMFNQLETVKKTSLFLILPICCIAAVGIGATLSHFQTVHTILFPLGLIGLVCILGVLARNMSKETLLSVSISLALLIAFSTAEELCGSLLMVFSQTHIDRMVFGFEIPSAAVAAINPLTIILLGPFMAREEIRYGVKLSLAFLSLAAAFFVLYGASIGAHPTILYLGAGLSLIAIGELFLAPTVISFASKAAGRKMPAMMMGATTLALSMGSLLSGEVATVQFEPQVTFLLIGGVSLAIFILLFLKNPLALER